MNTFATNGLILPLLNAVYCLVSLFIEVIASTAFDHFTASMHFPSKPSSVSIFPCLTSPSYLNIRPI